VEEAAVAVVAEPRAQAELQQILRRRMPINLRKHPGDRERR